jgi:hypothetical protein
MGDVRGASIVGTIKFLREHHGPDAPARVLAALEPLTRQALADGGPALLEAGWYPCGALSDLTRAADRLYGKGDLALCREIGRECAFDDMNRFFKWLLKLAGPGTLFKRAESVFNNYHNVGRYVAESSGPQHASIRLENWNSADPVMCKRIEGWIERALELTLGSGTRPIIKESAHLVREPLVSPHLFCRYEARWG